MAIEFKNANSFRAYPFRQFPNVDDSSLSDVELMSRSIVDAQFDVFCDRVRVESTDTSPLVIVKSAQFIPGGEDTAYTLKITLAVGFGLRDYDTDKPVFNTPTSRKWFSLSTIKITPQAGTDDSYYQYLWVSESSSDFDLQVDPSGEDAFEGTDMYITGYIAIDSKYLSTRVLPRFPSFTASGTDGDGNTTIKLLDHAPILEEGAVIFTGAQLVRNIYIANKEAIRPPDSSDIAVPPREIEVVVDSKSIPEVFQNDVKLEEGFNCRIDTNQQTGVITITPVIGAGQGEPCLESDPKAGEDGCNDFVYSINGVNSSNSGDVGFHGVPPLQVFAGDPSFRKGTDYVKGTNFPDLLQLDESDFWSHALVFRIGGWGDTDDTFCADPVCDK